MTTTLKQINIFFLQFVETGMTTSGKKRKLSILLWERVQQKAPMVPMRTMRATKAPTAMPMITATGNDSAENNQRGTFYTLQTLQMRDTLTHIRSGFLQPIPYTGRYSVAISSQAKGLKRKNNTSWIADSNQADKENSRYQCTDLCQCCFIEFNNLNLVSFMLITEFSECYYFYLLGVHIHNCSDVAPVRRWNSDTHLNSSQTSSLEQTLIILVSRPHWWPSGFWVNANACFPPHSPPLKPI